MNTSIFDIENAVAAFCRVQEYNRSLSRLRLTIYNAETKSVSEVVFSLTEYFAGPLTWKGARFYLGSPKECLELLKLSGKDYGVPDNDLVNQYHLYLAEIVHSLNHEQVKIIAETVGISAKAS